MLSITTNEEISKRLSLFFKNSNSWSEVVREEDTNLVKARRILQVYNDVFAVVIRTYPEPDSDKWFVLSLLYIQENGAYVGCSKSGFKVESDYNLVLSALCNSLEKTLSRYKESTNS